ncbi:MAG: hypothetical protein Q9208_002872 [Pyrenodesmia sp. 3 TL-2023]
MAISISSSLIACRNVFNELIEEIKKPVIEKPEGLYLQDWEDERGRLRLWAANIGAHQTGQSSLNFRLRDSSHIQEQIIKLLGSLTQKLRDSKLVLAEGEDPDVESFEDSLSENEEPQTELEQLRETVANIINCLFRMSILVRKPAQHDIRIGAKQIDVSGYEWADLRHVKDKFPVVDDRLAARLGRAITRRRKYLMYRKRHADKLRQGIDHDTQPETFPTGSDILSETVATDVRTWNIDADDRASESGFSQTSYAPTLISGGAITIPNPPEASHKGTPFECPYCYYVITAPSTKSWNHHVFHDLQPYVCTDPRCTTPDKLYATRHEWVHHSRTAHGHEVNSPHICTLCGASQKTLEGHHQHVARHLQELALFILPQNDEDSDGHESGVKLGADSSRGPSASNRMGEMQDAFGLDTGHEGSDQDASVHQEVIDPRSEPLDPSRESAVIQTSPELDAPRDAEGSALQDAFSYIDRVKLHFIGQPENYVRFLDILNDFKSQSIDTSGVVNRLSILLAGAPELIQGLNAHLPPLYRINFTTAHDSIAIHTSTDPGRNSEGQSGSDITDLQDVDVNEFNEEHRHPETTAALDPEERDWLSSMRAEGTTSDDMAEVRAQMDSRLFFADRYAHKLDEHSLFKYFGSHRLEVQKAHEEFLDSQILKNKPRQRGRSVTQGASTRSVSGSGIQQYSEENTEIVVKDAERKRESSTSFTPDEDSELQSWRKRFGQSQWRLANPPASMAYPPR